MASWSFGSGQRADFAKGNKVPGPNNYSIQKPKDGPAFGMGLKLDNHSLIGTTVRKTVGNPGSGTYNPDYKPAKKQMPAFSMQARHKNAAPQKVPGPGAYNSKGSPNKKAAPSFGFGTASQREKPRETFAPGVGTYSVPCSIGNLPNYTGARS